MCPDCLQSAARQHHGFTADCQGCAARAVSRGINFRDAKKAGRQTPRYRAELEQMGVTHDEVLRAGAADKVGVR